MSKKPAPWLYGQSPDPTNWSDAAAILKTLDKSKPKPKGPSLMDRLDAIEQLIREKE